MILNVLKTNSLVYDTDIESLTFWNSGILN